MSDKKKIIKRILGGAGANIIAQAVNTALQLASLPIFLTYWSLGNYGVWLMMSSIPAYIALCDFGVVTVTSNLMVMSSSQGKNQESVKIFKCGFMATTVAILALILALFLFVIAAVSSDVIEQKNAPVIFLLSGAAFLGIYTGLIEAIYRANNNFAMGVNVATGVRVFEWISLIGMYFLTKSFIGVASGAFVGRLLALLFSYNYTVNKYQDYILRDVNFSREEVYKLFSKGMGFMAFPVGNSIHVQGLILIAGTMFGASYAAFFGIYRTISRSIVQMTAVFSRAIWPEITAAYANKNTNLIKKLVFRGGCITFSSSLLLSVLIVFEGEFLVKIWTNGRVFYEEAFMVKILITTLLSSVWQVPYVALMATNNTKKISIVYLLASLISVFMAYIFSSIEGKDSLIFSIGFFEITLLIGSLFLVNDVYGVKNDMRIV